jgi:hypothetical protein
MTDAELLASFHACTLTHEQWTHRAHVKVAYLTLRQYSFPEALAHLRDAIKKLNATHGTPETLTRGYNETTTRALLQIIAAVMHAYAEAFPVGSADEFYDTHPQLHTKHVLRFFYSPTRRMHPDAKYTFVEPDLTPLPALPTSA